MKLTKIFTLLVLILLLSTSFSTAQIKLGGYFGMNFADISTSNPTSTTGSRTGFIFGSLVEIKIAKAFMVQPEVRYIMKGCTNTGTYVDPNTGQNATYKATYALNYIEIPLFLKAKFPLTEFKPYIVAGPTLGFNVSSSLTYDVPGTTTTDLGPNTESIDFGLEFGAGGEFAVTPKVDIFTEFHYHLGLTNVNKTAGSSQTWKNMGFQVLAGAKFGL